MKHPSLPQHGGVFFHVCVFEKRKYRNMRGGEGGLDWEMGHNSMCLFIRRWVLEIETVLKLDSNSVF